MSDRGFRRPYVRPRGESDAGEEEGFLYCLMYYFGEYQEWGGIGGGRERERRTGERVLLRLTIPPNTDFHFLLLRTIQKLHLLLHALLR